MNIMPTDAVVVTELAGNTARLYSSTRVYDADLTAAGFSRTGDELSRPIGDDDDRQSLVRFLIEIDAMFSSGHDWSPEAIVEEYRGRGFTNRTYRIVAWTAPGRYVVSIR
jgi:hypothetical protein